MGTAEIWSFALGTGALIQHLDEEALGDVDNMRCSCYSEKIRKPLYNRKEE
jgi:hypothetical protein